MALAQVGHYYFGAVSQYYFGGNNRRADMQVSRIGRPVRRCGQTET